MTNGFNLRGIIAPAGYGSDELRESLDSLLDGFLVDLATKLLLLLPLPFAL